MLCLGCINAYVANRDLCPSSQFIREFVRDKYEDCLNCVPINDSCDLGLDVWRRVGWSSKANDHQYTDSTQ